jgi:hypothetical protein
MSLAEIISSMPSVASTISTGSSNLSIRSALAWPTVITIAVMEPIRTSTFMNFANGSDRKAPL